METNILFENARNIAALIQSKQLSVREVVEAHLKQIEAINPKVNAIVSLDAEAALEEADRRDEQLAKNERVGRLHGIPIAIKDTHHAKGFPTTYGSTVFKDYYPDRDEILVERLRAAGAIIIGKTNVPEFAAGAHTFNNVFGVTRNPYNLNRTAGGSSGGAAVAVATGMIPLADGSDFGGSCRFPAAFNNVVGLRTSPGRVPIEEKKALYSPLNVHGPIARTVEDVAFMLSVIAGPDVRSPLSIEESGDMFLSPLEIDMRGLKIAWSSDLGGSLLVDRDVKETFEKQVKIFADLGCHLEEDWPDLSDANYVFQTLRAFEMELTYADILDRHEAELKPSFVWNLKKGRELKGTDIGKAERIRQQLYHRVRAFFEKYDAFVLPVSQVPPFPIEWEYPQHINGVKVENYIDWVRSCSDISALGTPALSVPAGFTPDGLPFGMQIVGPYRGDFKVLQIGYAFEQATNYAKIRPSLLEKSKKE